jgi:hypothetical protein
MPTRTIVLTVAAENHLRLEVCDDEGRPWGPERPALVRRHVGAGDRAGGRSRSLRFPALGPRLPSVECAGSHAPEFGDYWAVEYRTALTLWISAACPAADIALVQRRLPVVRALRFPSPRPS